MPISINPDHDLETDDGTRLWTAERGAEAWRLAFERLTDILAKSPHIRRVVVVCGLQGAGKTRWISEQSDESRIIYFDAALPGARHREPVIQIARSHGVLIDAVWIHVPIDVALERNRRRRVDHMLPEATIRSVHRIFQPPTLAEGFDGVTIVDWTR